MTRVFEHVATPICPVCGKPAEARETQYGVRHECCDLHSWGGKPLQDQATHDARKAAHAAFDPLWKGPTRIMKRKHAYKRLAQLLGIPRQECHISLMDRDTAERVPFLVDQIRLEES